MKTSRILMAASAILLLAVSPAFANPDMLPKHPGYPMDKAIDPVKGQSLANDPGQSNATGAGSLANAAAFDDSHSKQSLSINQSNLQIMEKPGAGVPPKVQGPNITNEPRVK